MPIIIFLSFFIICMLITLLPYALFLLLWFLTIPVTIIISMIYIIIGLKKILKKKELKNAMTYIVCGLLCIGIFFLLISQNYENFNDYNFLYFQAKKQYGSLRKFECHPTGSGCGINSAECKIVINDEYKIPINAKVGCSDIFGKASRNYTDDYQYKYINYFLDEYNKRNNTNIKIKKINNQIVYILESNPSTEDCEKIEELNGYIESKMKSNINYYVNVGEDKYPNKIYCYNR